MRFAGKRRQSAYKDPQQRRLGSAVIAGFDLIDSGHCGE